MPHYTDWVTNFKANISLQHQADSANNAVGKPESLIVPIESDDIIRQPDADAALAIAKEAGFMISADDITKAQSEISDEELENVAGGTINCMCSWTRDYNCMHGGTKLGTTA